MFEFVNWLRVIAAIFITNSHYADVWPNASLAFGGQLGNNLFFILSGFCLYNVKESFPKWYARRVLRIFPVVWITNIIYLGVDYFCINNFSDFIHFFIYPTGFHFVGTIMVMYIMLYVVRTIQNRFKFKIEYAMIFIFVFFLGIYIIMFDKSIYHIDSVSEKWVWFMFSESILMGLLLREKYEKISKDIHCYDLIKVLLLFGAYFVGKKTFSNIQICAPLQILQPIIVVTLTTSITILFIKMQKNNFFESKIKCLNPFIAFFPQLHWKYI